MKIIKRFYFLHQHQMIQVKTHKISINNFKIHKTPYSYETDPITEWMVKIPSSRHWRRVYFYSPSSKNSKYVGRTLLLGPGEDFSFNESFYYVKTTGAGSNFIPIELAPEIYEMMKK